MEIWKDIKGFEGLYQVSNLGRVRSLDRYVPSKNGSLRFSKGLLRKIMINRDGYHRVALCLDGFLRNYFVHRLVAEAFIPNIENKPQVNHINGLKTDNSISNLEWVTSAENQKHAYRTGLKCASEKQKEVARKTLKEKGLDKSKIIIDTSTGIYYDSIKEAALSIGVKATTMSSRLSGVCANRTSLRYA